MARGSGGTVDDMAGQVVFVTGASRGIGAEVARRFAAAGAEVGLVARDVEALRTVVAELPAGRAHAAAADVADADRLARAFRALEAHLGPATVLVTCAGHGTWGAVVDTNRLDFRHAMEVNYLGVVHATGLVLGGMLRRDRGHIVHVASIAGRIGAPFEAAYSASKFAVVGYTEALAAEIDGTGVRVSLVNPGPVDTGFFDQRDHPAPGGAPRPIPPARVAEAIVAAVRSDRHEQFLPHWLRAAHAVKTVAPPLHRLGVRRRYAKERRALQRRYD